MAAAKASSDALSVNAVGREAIVRRDAAHLKKTQRHLDHLLQQDPPDWPEIRSLVGVFEGLNPNRTDIEAMLTTLHRAAYAGEVEVARWCISCSADVSVKTSIGRTALHYACDSDQAEMVKLLLCRRANPNEPSLSGSTPVHLLCERNALHALKALEESSLVLLNFDAEDTKRRTPLSLVRGEEMREQIAIYQLNEDRLSRILYMRTLALELLGGKEWEFARYLFGVWKAHREVAEDVLPEAVQRADEVAEVTMHDDSRGGTMGSNEFETEAGLAEDAEDAPTDQPYVPSYAAMMGDMMRPPTP